MHCYIFVEKFKRNSYEKRDSTRIKETDVHSW